MNEKATNGLKEYQRKIEAGEIERAKTMTPAEKAEANPKSLRAAINAKCWDCCCQSRTEVGLCESETCPLWNLRPWTKKETA